MNNPPNQRCGFVWPEDCGQVDVRTDDVDSPSCCVREIVNDSTDRCIWHADLGTDKKTDDALTDVLAPPTIREQNRPQAELIDGAILNRCAPSVVPLSKTSLRGSEIRHADLSTVDLSGANLSEADLFKTKLMDSDLSKANLTNAVLSGAQMAYADLDHTDLTNAALIRTELIDAHLMNACLAEADLRKADLSGAYLEDADLTNANLKHANLSNANLSGATLTNADLTEANLTDVDLTEAKLNRANLTNANLTEAYLFEADLIESDLIDANLTESCFSEADLSKSNLNSADLSEAVLRKTILIQAKLNNAELANAILYGANLSETGLFKADLTDSDLNNTNLTEADLTDTDLTNADISGANLTSASLIGANMSSTDLGDTNLTNTDLRQANLSNVTVNRATKIDTLSQVEKQVEQASGGSQATGIEELDEIDVDTEAEQLAAVQGMVKDDNFSHRGQKIDSWDDIARTYHALKTVFSENGLTGRARNFRMKERRARRKEAFAEGTLSGYSAWFGSLLSRVFTGYGVQLRWPIAVSLCIIFGSVGIYWQAGIEHSLSYSIVTFTTSPPMAPPRGGITEIVALTETFVGTLLVVLLGYVLGNRERI